MIRCPVVRTQELLNFFMMIYSEYITGTSLFFARKAQLVRRQKFPSEHLLLPPRVGREGNKKNRNYLMNVFSDDFIQIIPELALHRSEPVAKVILVSVVPAVGFASHGAGR